MKILMATSEAVPFAKTGGMADVCGTLPVELARLGHEPVLVLPAYRHARYCGVPVKPLGVDFIVPIGSKTISGHLLASRLPACDVPVYLIQQDQYFDRGDLYRSNGRDFADNCERFVFFCRAVLEAIRLLELNVDVIHANDWQTGLVPAFLDVEYRSLPRYRRTASLFTIHNMAYQGQFWHWDMLLTGLDWKYFTWHQMEYYGKLNLLKTGLVFADALSTVSPRYALEIQNPAFGCGLEGVLQNRRKVLTGILNGIDEAEWNPDADPLIRANYNVDTVDQGKPVCKAALQAEMGLPERDDVPLIGMIGRLADQKGFDLVAKMIPEWIAGNETQWVILGTGEPIYHQLFMDLARRHPDKIAVHLEFCDRLAHRIEAGADLFLMPSRYEPCGLNQMYSLRYGTLPVVRETGGLADTIVDTNEQSLAAGTANGFSFREDNPLALSETLARAVAAWRNRQIRSRLISTGMRQDWSWSRSARQYVRLYEQTVARVRSAEETELAPV